MDDKWSAFEERVAAKRRWVYAAFVSSAVALVAYHQGWFLVYAVALSVSGYLLIHVFLRAVWPDDPDVVKEPSRRW